MGGYGVKYGGNIQVAGKEDHFHGANDNSAAFYLTASHTQGGIDGDATAGPFVFISFRFIRSDENK